MRTARTRTDSRHRLREQAPSFGNSRHRIKLTAKHSDEANFINFCQGQDLTNGEQKEGGSCNGIRTYRDILFVYTDWTDKM